MKLSQYRTGIDTLHNGTTQMVEVLTVTSMLNVNDSSESTGNMSVGQKVWMFMRLNIQKASNTRYAIQTLHPVDVIIYSRSNGNACAIDHFVL